MGGATCETNRGPPLVPFLVSGLYSSKVNFSEKKKNQLLIVLKQIALSRGRKCPPLLSSVNVIHFPGIRKDFVLLYKEVIH